MKNPDLELHYHVVECWQKGCTANKPNYVCACSSDSKKTDCSGCEKLGQSIIEFFKEHPQYYGELALPKGKK